MYMGNTAKIYDANSHLTHFILDYIINNDDTSQLRVASRIAFPPTLSEKGF